MEIQVTTLEQMLQPTVISNNNKLTSTVKMSKTKLVIHKTGNAFFPKQNHILPSLHLMHCQKEQMQSHVICLCLDLFLGYIPARFHTSRNNSLCPLEHKFNNINKHTEYLIHITPTDLEN